MFLSPFFDIDLYQLHSHLYQCDPYFHLTPSYWARLSHFLINILFLGGCGGGGGVLSCSYYGDDNSSLSYILTIKSFAFILSSLVSTSTIGLYLKTYVEKVCSSYREKSELSSIFSIK